ncbi:phosphotransferase [Fundidesulfovibrio butyratiphilus]
MPGVYIGHVVTADPLYAFMRDDLLPQMGVFSRTPRLRVFALSGSRAVYLYEDAGSGARVAGKFQRLPGRSGLPPRYATQTEYNNLVHLRSLGFDHHPDYVVRPLGYNAAMGHALFTEFLEGDPLDSVIRGAMHQNRRSRLYRKLTNLARFLSRLHNRTAGDWGVNFDHVHAYSDRLVGSLVIKRGLGFDQADELHRLRNAWRANPVMWQDRAVLVHGDATPANFLFGSGPHVMAIDLERMQWADRCFDLGRLCGELGHFFHQGLGDPLAAEPFIGHFLWEYACHFPDRQRAFSAITARIPYYMGITLLRIARNSWIDPHYRRQLVERAKTVLRGHA